MKNRPDVQKLVFSVATGLSLLAAPAVRADLYMQFATKKTCLQSAPYTQTFTGGTFEVQLRDGQITLDTSCVIQPQLFFFGPSVLPPCPLGATAFIASGDVNRDGIRDDLQYWSVLSDVPAYYIEPYRPDLVFLSAAPASTLPRPLGLFRDDSVTSFYNITSTTLQYDMSRYELIRTYDPGNGELARMKRDLPFGQYQYTYPSLGRPDRPLAIPVTLTPFVDPFQPTTNEKTGFRITNDRWNAGNLEMDPRLINKITWQGNDNRAVRTGVDTLRFGIYDSADSAITFPASGELTIPNPLTNYYYIPPYFYDVGDLETMRFTFSRNQPLNQISYDVSQRQFKAKVRFIELFAGYSAVTFPLGSTSLQTKTTGDYDADGYSNLLEFAYQSDLLNTGKAEPSRGDVPLVEIIPPIVVDANGNPTSRRRVTFPKFVTSSPACLNTLQVRGATGAAWDDLYPAGATTLISDDGITIVVRTNAFYPNNDPGTKFRCMHVPAATPLLTGSFDITNLGGNIQQVTILKRPLVSTSLTYGIERKDGTKWVAEKIPTVVGASNGRWTLNANDETSMIFTSVVPIPSPPTVFRPAVKQNY